MNVNDELESMRKKAVVMCVEVLYQHLRGGKEESRGQASGPSFELRTSKVRSTSASHLAGISVNVKVKLSMYLN
jgi:hypothetical protein